MLRSDRGEPPAHDAAGGPTPPSTLTHRTLAGLAWQLLGTGSEIACKVIVIVVLARLLSPRDFGIVGAAQTIIGLAVVFSQLGVGQAIVQRKDLSEDHLRTGFAVSLVSGLVITAAMIAMAQLIDDFFRTPELTPVVIVLSLYFPLTNASIVSESLLQRDLQFKKLAAADVLSFVLGYGVVGIVLGCLGAGYWALVAAQIAQIVLRSAILLMMRWHAMTPSIKIGPLKELLGFGFGQSLAQFGNYSAMQMDNLVVGRLMGTVELGLYGRAYQFLMLPTNLFGKVVDRVLFPSMALVQNDQARLSRAFSRSVAIVAMVTLPVGGFLALLAPELVAVLLGQKWIGMVAPFQVLGATLIFRTSYKMSDSLARATGSVYRRAWRQWVYAGGVFLGALIGTRWGLTGVAFGVSTAIALNFLLMLQLSLQLTGVSWTEIREIHVRHLLSTALILVPVALLLHFARAAHVNSVLILVMASVLSVAVVWLLFVVVRPLFGQEGVWVHELLDQGLRRVRAPRSLAKQQ